MVTNSSPPKKSSNRLFLYALLFVLAFVALKAFQNRRQHVTRASTGEFPAGGTWLGVKEPKQLAALRGKVVLLQFSFINCRYCREMDPHLHRWQDQFGPDGLVIIEIDDGSADSLEDVRNWMARANITYPVYYDARGQMIGSYGIDSFPTLLLIGRDGKVAWEGSGWNGKAGVDKLENEIRKALKQ